MRRSDRERGQVVALFALMIPMFLALVGFVIGIGNWYVHGKHLQTKADAGALAGGVSWAFPCAADIDTNIGTQARLYAGSNNPQVGGVPDADVKVRLNALDWYDNDSNPFQGDFDSPSGSVCAARSLDVKVTEDNSFPLASLIPLFPDIKRRARVEIREAQGIGGLLPIGVRLPRPESAAAVFYNEVTGVILDVKYFCEVPGGFGGLPAGLGGWRTLDPSNPMCSSWANVNVPGNGKTGVVIATSVRPACGFGTPPGTPPCLEDSGWVGQPVNNFCRQAAGTVQCWDATGFGSTQNVQSGVQFIRGYGSTGNGNGPPTVQSVFLDSAPATCGGAYFNSIPSTCAGSRLSVQINLGTLTGTYPNSSPPPANVVAPLRASDVQVAYMLGRSNGSTQCNGYPASCQLVAANPNATGVVTFTTTAANAPQFTADSQANAIALQVQVRNTTNLSPGPQCANFSPQCRWFYIGSGRVNQNQADTAAELVASPLQRSFAGSVDRTGPLKWIRMSADTSMPCDVPNLGLAETAEAASVPAGPTCFYLEMGLQGAVAVDQDEPPIAFNLGSTGSQRAFLDCDPGPGTNLSTEIQLGCTPLYQAHPFTYSPYCPADNNPAALLGPHPPPWDATNNWPPPQCVVTQTGAGNQVMQGFNQRLFGVSNNPSCPPETSNFVPGRNYWHDANNANDNFTFAQDSPAPARGNRLKLVEDPRYVTLFFTSYDSFTSSGNETFPIVGFGGFYVTGYGRTTGGGGSWQGGAPEDPCVGGNSGNPFDGLPFGVGNEPPPDLNLGANQTWVWGHFITPVFLTNNASPSAKLCNPTGGKPCVAVLVD